MTERDKTPMDTQTLTKKELATRWGCSVRTVERAVRQFPVTPVAFIGHQPVFDLPSILNMEERRTRYRLEKAGYATPDTQIITVKEAKRRAGKGRR